MRIWMCSRYDLWGTIRPTDLRRPDAPGQIGGAETALMSVARELARRGHEVTVFMNAAPGRHDGVEYRAPESFRFSAAAEEHDVLVAWDAPEALGSESRSRVRVLAFQMNDAAIGPLSSRIDAYFHPSRWHARRFAGLYPEIDPARQRAPITNAVDTLRFARAPERDPFRVFYSSSPDRGLHHLLRIWPRIHEREPRATLHVFYEVERWLDRSLKIPASADPVAHRSHTRAVEVAEGIARCRRRGLVMHGAIGPWRLAEEQLRSTVLAYPCDPLLPSEGFSMTCLEALTAGCRLVLTDADALGELWGGRPNVACLPRPVDDEAWVAEILAALHARPLTPGARMELATDWSAIAALWERELTRLLMEREPRRIDRIRLKIARMRQDLFPLRPRLVEHEQSR